MILEVDDGGRLETIAVIGNSTNYAVNGRRFIGGYRLNASGYESIWFDKAVWDIALVSEDEYFKTYRLTRKAS